MPKIDRIAKWLFTTAILAIIVAIPKLILDDLEIAITIFLTFFSFLLLGIVVYEISNYFYKKLKK
jgi:hypothetical protein